MKRRAHTARHHRGGGMPPMGIPASTTATAMAGKAAGDAFLFWPGAQKSPGPQGSGAGRGLLLRNGHTKGIGVAIDGFVSDCDFQAGDRDEITGGRVLIKILTIDAETYLRGGQL